MCIWLQSWSSSRASEGLGRHLQSKLEEQQNCSRWVQSFYKKSVKEAGFKWQVQGYESQERSGDCNKGVRIKSCASLLWAYCSVVQGFSLTTEIFQGCGGGPWMSMTGPYEAITIHNLPLQYLSRKTFLVTKLNEYGGTCVAKAWQNWWLE